MRTERIAMPLFRATAKRDWASRIADRLLQPWNPFTPGRYSNPYPLYEAIRSSGGPISYQRSLKGWNVVGYEACEDVLRNTEMSVNRTNLFTIVRPYNKLKPDSRSLFLSTMLLQDPPDHTRLRTLVNRAFTPRRMAALEPNVEQLARELVDSIPVGGHVDAMEVFCNRLPIRVISDMLGLPREHWDEFQALSDQLIKFVDPIVAFEPPQMEVAVARFRSIIGGLITQRRAEPQDDMVTRLVEAQEDGDRLNDRELESMIAILMVAGHETSAGFFGNALVALHDHPEAREQLRTEPAIVPNAIEELLRYDTAVQQTNRVATADLEIAGQQVAKGDILGVFFAAANRDPDRYDQPARLRLDRLDPRPLSFGHGIHHCLGAALARIEARVALPMFVEAFPDYRVDTDRVEWKRSLNVRGPLHLPMRL